MAKIVVDFLDSISDGFTMLMLVIIMATDVLIFLLLMQGEIPLDGSFAVLAIFNGFGVFVAAIRAIKYFEKDAEKSAR